MLLVHALHSLITSYEVMRSCAFVLAALAKPTKKATCGSWVRVSHKVVFGGKQGTRGTSGRVR